MEDGRDGNDLRAFLSERDAQPLPETVEGFLRNVERGARALRLQGRAMLIACADEEIAARLGAGRLTAKLCTRRLVVQTKSETAFRNAARDIGYSLPGN